MFDVVHGIALHPVHCNQASSRGEGEVSWFFSSCGRTLGYILQLRQGWPFKTRVCSVMVGLLSSCEGHLRILLRLFTAIGTPLDLRRETQFPFPVATRIFGFLSILKSSQALSPFEALNSAFLSSCQKYVRPPIEMRRGFRAFSRVFTGDLNTPSYCEMKDEPSFMSLQ